MTTGFRMTHDPSPAARFRRQRNLEILDLLLPLVIEGISGGKSIDEIVIALARQLSQSRQQVRGLVTGLSVLHRLPRCLRAARTHAHLDESRITTLGTRLKRLTSDELLLVDEHLSAVLTPGVSDQELVQAPALSKRLDKIVGALGLDAKEHVAAVPRASARVDSENNYRFTLCLPQLEGAQLYEQILSVMRKKKVDFARAMLSLLGGEKPPRVHLNLFQDPSGLIYAAGGGWLPPEELSRAKVLSRRVLSEAESTERYGIPERLRALVTGRDGHCRYPGCTVDAGECDVDHVIPFGKGGTTTADNLHLLCRHHHNLKTAGEAQVVMHPNGTDTWTMDNGSQFVTLPEGPWADLMLSTAAVTRPPVLAAS